MIDEFPPIAFVTYIFEGKKIVPFEVTPEVTFGNPIKITFNEPKKNKQKKFKWEVNRVYKDFWVVRF